MALSKSGKLYSWGYKGKGLLGRKCDEFATYNTPLNIEAISSI